MDADDLLEVRVRPESERERAAGIEVARPAGDDPHDRLVGLTPDAPHCVVAGNAP